MGRCVDQLYEAVKKTLVRIVLHQYPQFEHFSRVDQDEGRGVPSIAASMITGLSEDPTEEEILMAKGLPGSIYLGTIIYWMV
jgi:hypothetical protein